MAEDKLIQEIKYLKDVQKLSFRQIEEEAGIPRKKASRLYSGNSTLIIKRDKKLNQHQKMIEYWYSVHPNLKAKQIYWRLLEMGVQVSYPTVSRMTSSFRTKKQQIYWPLHFNPGEEAQVDWFFRTHPLLGKCCGFTIILSYSRYVFACFFPRHSFEFFIEGHLKAFEAFRGTPHAMKYDNLKSVVLKRQPLTYNPSFLEFAHYYGFDIRLCNPGKGNEKGRVERLVRSISDTFWNTADHHHSFKALNQSLREWCDRKNNTVHRSTRKKPIELKGQEKLKPLPVNPWKNVIIHPPKKFTKTGFVLFDTNYYSIPDYLSNPWVHIHSFVDNIQITTLNGKKIASHPRSFEKFKSFLNPLHRSYRQISSLTKRERIYQVMKQLNPIVETFLKRNQKCNENVYLSAYQLFKLLKIYSRETIYSAIRKSLKNNTPKIKQVLTYLDRDFDNQEEVFPNNLDLLKIDYQPRSLKEYENRA